MGTAIKYPVPDWVKPSCVIFDIRALQFLTHGWASECPDVKNYRWRLNPVWHRMHYCCTHMATVSVKGIEHCYESIYEHCSEKWHACCLTELCAVSLLSRRAWASWLVWHTTVATRTAMHCGTAAPTSASATTRRRRRVKNWSSRSTLTLIAGWQSESCQQRLYTVSVGLKMFSHSRLTCWKCQNSTSSMLSFKMH